MDFIGQVELFLRRLEKYERAEGEEKPIALIFSEHFYKNESMKIRFDDRQINLSFPIDIAVMSNQDRNAPYLAEIYW